LHSQKETFQPSFTVLFALLTNKSFVPLRAASQSSNKKYITNSTLLEKFSFLTQWILTSFYNSLKILQFTKKQLQRSFQFRSPLLSKSLLISKKLLRCFNSFFSFLQKIFSQILQPPPNQRSNYYIIVYQSFYLPS